MYDFIPHSNAQKRFYGKDKIYFITTNTSKRFPFFRESLFCELLIENLWVCKELKSFKLYGFIIIPDHIHFLLSTGEEFNVSKIMHAIKRHFSRNINIVIGENDKYESDNEYEGEIKYEGEVCKPRLHVEAHDFNKKIIKYRHKFIQQYGQPQYKIPKFEWHKSFHDYIIRNKKDFLKHLKYITLNCVKHKVCFNESNYRWSFLNPEFKNLIADFI